MNEIISIVQNNFCVSILVILALVIIISHYVKKIKYKQHLKECEKGNHEFENYISKWMIKPGKANKITGRDDYDAFSWRYNGFKYKRIDTECKHCCFLKEREWIKIGEFNSISMDSDDMDTYEEKGIVEWN